MTPRLLQTGALEAVPGQCQSGFATVAILRFANQPGRLPRKPGQGHTRARVMTCESQPAVGSMQCVQAPEAARLHPESCLAVGSVTCDDDSVAIFNITQGWVGGLNRASLRAWLTELAAGPEVCRGGADGGGPGFPAQSQGLAGRQEGRGGEHRKGTGSNSDSYVYFFNSGRKTVRPLTRSCGGEGPPGWWALPEGNMGCGEWIHFGTGFRSLAPRVPTELGTLSRWRVKTPCSGVTVPLHPLPRGLDPQGRGRLQLSEPSLGPLGIGGSEQRGKRVGEAGA